jgi:hypothetical protein
MPDVITASGIMSFGSGNGRHRPRFDTTYNRRDHGVPSAPALSSLSLSRSLSSAIQCCCRFTTLQVYYHGTALAALIGFGNNGTGARRYKIELPVILGFSISLHHQNECLNARQSGTPLASNYDLRNCCILQTGNGESWFGFGISSIQLRTAAWTARRKQDACTRCDERRYLLK